MNDVRDVLGFDGERMEGPENVVDTTTTDLVNWRDRLLLSVSGKRPRPLLANAITALRYAPEWRGVLAFNEFAHRAEAVKPPPWRAGANQWDCREWTGTDDILAAQWLQEADIAVSPDVTAQAVEAVSREGAFHPVRDYLDGLTWDGRKRIAALAPIYFGTDDGLYQREIGRRFLISAVARIYVPGCKVDHLPILEGKQGTLKSTGLRTLTGAQWFTDEIEELGTKDAALQVRGVWVVEVAELSSMRRGEVERVKAFLTRTVDRFRPPYGRRLIESPRQCVLAGTTNAETYLKDETGARRFWPIKCGSIEIDALDRDRDQLWAEARANYREGEKWWLDTPELVQAAAAEQDARQEGDPWDDVVCKYLSAHDEVTTDEILRNVLDIEKDKLTRQAEMRVGAILRRQDWTRHQVRADNRRMYVYRKAE